MVVYNVGECFHFAVSTKDGMIVLGKAHVCSAKVIFCVAWELQTAGLL